MCVRERPVRRLYRRDGRDPGQDEGRPSTSSSPRVRTWDGKAVAPRSHLRRDAAAVLQQARDQARDGVTRPGGVWRRQANDREVDPGRHREVHLDGTVTRPAQRHNFYFPPFLLAVRTVPVGRERQRGICQGRHGEGSIGRRLLRRGSVAGRQGPGGSGYTYGRESFKRVFSAGRSGVCVWRRTDPGKSGSE